MRGSWLRSAGCAALVWAGVGLCAVPAQGSGRTKSSGQKHAVKLTPWEVAERGRETLEAIPAESRTKADYTTAMDGFRAVYHETPGDVHAPSAVNEVAELLAEQGRSLHDAKSLKAAVGQYEFLRTQYPGSSLRVGALLAEAQIFENDLGDKKSAKEKYELLVTQYPGSSKAEEARAGLAALSSGGRDESAGSRVHGAEAKVERPAATSGSAGASLPGAPGASTLGAMPVTGTPVGSPELAASAAAANVSGLRGGGAAASGVDASGERHGVVSSAEFEGAARPVSETHDAKKVRRHGGLAQVTGIRHWSTPSYTRVAIDLGDNVTYEAARVPNPDRIYFDLHGTQLARDLVGKSFAVTDDGFLKKIRAAQFSNDMTRVVLDVNDVTEYSAFLLPNPYRLIIDVHGRTPGAKANAELAEVKPESPTGAASGGERATGTAGSTGTTGTAGKMGADALSGRALAAEVPGPRTATAERSTAARPVPNTVTTRGSSTTEIASLSTEPGRVGATSVPTSRPISAVVDEPAKGSPKDTGGDVAVAVPAKRVRRGKNGKIIRDHDVDAVPARAAVPTADGETSLVRALGLKIGRIVIDAGHGGHDSGTIGVDGLEEKDVVLDVALRVGKLLHDRLGAEIVYTRSDDTFIPLETRTAIANKAQADLFLSIHANSSSDESARGVETYYLNFTTSPDALETAARENAVSDQSIHQLSDLVKKIALKDKIAESREFASDVEKSLYGGLQRGNAGLKDRGVKKAPFVVLIGANMPSILAEISFVTNPKDAEQLREPEYRERVAESLYKGVAKYASGLSGVKAGGPSTERASVK